MAFGRHWEWRGFGYLDAKLRNRIESQPAAFPSSQELVDTYLWSPRSGVNMKLRAGALKLKRLLSEADGLEEWLEDPSENFAFPISRTQLRALRDALQVETLDTTATVIDRTALLDLLKRFVPEVRVIEVAKRRQQYRVDDADARRTTASGLSSGVTLEVAEILSPEIITTVGVEHADARAVATICKQFGLADSLRTLNYLDAIAAWSRGEHLA
ncbi:MAG: hypothetical protein MK538_06020 [Planctomycetes bacterium]|nr:hypothetical protein [Planctomycetota bacterium]